MMGEGSCEVSCAPFHSKDTNCLCSLFRHAALYSGSAPLMMGEESCEVSCAPFHSKDTNCLCRAVKAGGGGGAEVCMYDVCVCLCLNLCVR
jgi:hypothetical protein